MAAARHPAAGVLSDLPDRLLANLLAKAKPVNLAAHEILFLAGDLGDGCYRVNEGLLKISIASPPALSVFLPYWVPVRSSATWR